MNSARRHSRHLRSATGVGVGRVNGAKASGFDADGKIYRLDSRASSRMTARGAVSRHPGFPSKLENDGTIRLVNFSFEGR